MKSSFQKISFKKISIYFEKIWSIVRRFDFFQEDLISFKKISISFQKMSILKYFGLWMQFYMTFIVSGLHVLCQFMTFIFMKVTNLSLIILSHRAAWKIIIISEQTFHKSVTPLAWLFWLQKCSSRLQKSVGAEEV